MPLILMIEQDNELRSLMYRFLAAAGHEIAIADDALEGAALMRQLHPDLLLIDDDLASLRGADLVRSLHGDPETANTPIFLLADPRRVSAKQARELGCAGYLAKPFDLSTGIARVIEVARAVTRSRRP